MVKEASIIFSNDDRVVTNELVKQFIESDAKDFSIVFMNDTLYAVVKEVKKEKQTANKVRMIAGFLARELEKHKVELATLNEHALTDAFTELQETDLVTAFIEGWHLGAYKFLAHKSKQTATDVKLQFTDEERVKEAIVLGIARAEATAFSRNLMNEIPSVLNPETFPKILKKELADTGVRVVVHDEDDLEEMEMNGILAVNRGSKYDPAMIELHYEGDATKPLIALVGKGVTFDTGGISLKGGRDLSDMRMDMGGAAAVAGAIKLLASTNAPVNVVGVIQTVENMPDKKSLLPGDVIRYKNGKTVQVGNTDAEGRLILADGLIRAGELKADYVVDIATLTGAIAHALGSKIGGVFGDTELTQTMHKIGDENGDFVWPMPLIEDYDSYLKSDYADFSNISNKGEAGAITAALFLRKFVPDTSKWLHVDMAGVMESQETGYYAKSATGYGVRLLADYAVHISN